MKWQMNEVLRMVPMALAMGTIFFVSHQPGDSLSLPQLPGFDKLAHMISYGVLAMAVFFAWSEQQKSSKPRAVMLATLVFCLLYGISDEFHQSFIPGRTVSVYDLLADGVGAAMACAFWAKYRKRITIISSL
jgi:VanZ family protein